MLNYGFIYDLYPKSIGIQDKIMTFNTVTISESHPCSRCLFIPFDESQSLLTAIGNGAIAAVWQEEWPIPAYTPNHFPMFIVTNTKCAYQQIFAEYAKLIDKNRKKEWENMTNFVFYASNLLKEEIKTYDIAVQKDRDKLMKLIDENCSEGTGK
ncbi:hypothetical protein [Falsibacillus albus]|uniref:Uncharacterized protein n=1 Tax=Falsibacillus albus TaxID=2478915 RepID=A0A3L7JYL3_9BACI|nr:hypothetical protein [Falsibacillus albus]RLQ95833.1 hypothetical protein D9X91_09440 [Falsibacillus albus]